VLVAMSGGVDSSVAAAALLDQGHQVVGVTLKLWGGAQDSGCCSVSDVDDARRVAQQLGIPHHVFNFSEEFEASVVGPYVTAHARGRTPNPCIECNRRIKFARLLARAVQLGFDAMATGHHARVVQGATGGWELRRGADRAKDQSYVLHMLEQNQLARVLMPVGEMTKAEVRSQAAAMGLRTADKPDSQDTCFIAAAAGGRSAFLGARLDLHPGRLVDAGSGDDVGTVPAVELVTVGQRRGLGAGPGGVRRFAVAVDVGAATVVVGSREDLHTSAVAVEAWSWVGAAVAIGTTVAVQTSAHGAMAPGVVSATGISFASPQRRVAPGQAVVLYEQPAAVRVLGGGAAV
jgi:tRNA-uridine 2-sulfurtransferase